MPPDRLPPALLTLVERLIDYPGNGSPEDLEAYRSLSQSGDSEVLRGLVWPSEALPVLLDLPAGEELSVSVVGGEGAEPGRDSEWDFRRTEDARNLTAFVREAPESIALFAYEAPLPGDRQIIEGLRSLSGFNAGEVYVELSGELPLDEALSALSERDWASPKLRVIAKDPRRLAEFIYECVSLELPFKLTGEIAGVVTQSDAIGILNALVATALAVREDLNIEEILTILLSAAPPWQDLDAESAEDARGIFDAVESRSLQEFAEALRTFVGGAQA